MKITAEPLRCQLDWLGRDGPVEQWLHQQRISDVQAAFPDLHFTVEDLVAEGDRVVFRAIMRGSHQGAFRNIAPTGRPIAVTVLDIVRVEDGAFAEQWGGPDLLDLLLQLGAVMSVR